MTMKNRGIILRDVFECILKFILQRVLHIKLSDETWGNLMQFVKFAMVGFSNVIVSYGVYLVFLGVFQIVGILPDTDYLVAQWIGYVLSIFWSFYWNRKYVFAGGQEEIPWYTALIKSFIAYSFTGVFLNSVLSVVWVQIIGISKMIVPVINLVINVPVNFLMNKFWAFSRR